MYYYLLKLKFFGITLEALSLSKCKRKLYFTSCPPQYIFNILKPQQKCDLVESRLKIVVC